MLWTSSFQHKQRLNDKEFFQCVLEFCNIYYLLSVAENQANRKDKEGLSHPLFICVISEPYDQRKYLIIFFSLSRTIGTSQQSLPLRVAITDLIIDNKGFA